MFTDDTVIKTLTFPIPSTDESVSSSLFSRLTVYSSFGDEFFLSESKIIIAIKIVIAKGRAIKIKRLFFKKFLKLLNFSWLVV